MNQAAGSWWLLESLLPGLQGRREGCGTRENTARSALPGACSSRRLGMDKSTVAEVPGHVASAAQAAWGASPTTV